MGPAAVAFDLDYTLAVPSRDRATLLSAATDRVGAPALTRDEYLDAHAQHLTEETRAPIFETLLYEYDTDVTADDLAAAYRDLVTHSLVPVPGAESLLSTLRADYRVGLLTNGPVVAQTDKLDYLDWHDDFDVAIVTGALDAGKPDAAAFEALLDRLGTSPSATVYVGDDVDADVAGAAGAGLKPVQVLFEGSADPHPDAVAHVERDRLATELPRVLADL